MIEYYACREHEPVSKLSEFAKGAWINVVCPNSRELSLLSKKFALDKDNLYSGLDENEIPRYDDYDGKLYLYVKWADKDKPELKTLLIIVSEDFIITLSLKQPSFLNDFKTGKTNINTTRTTEFLIQIISHITFGFENWVLAITRIVQTKKQLNKRLNENDINNFLEYEDALNSFVSTSAYMNMVYDKIMRKRISEDNKMQLEELSMDLKQTYNLGFSSLKTISNIRNYYSILLSNRLNQLINLLTVFTIVLSITSAVSGLYGMNLPLPFQESPLAFYGIISVIIILTLSLLFYIKNRI